MVNGSTFSKHLTELHKYLGYLRELKRHSKKAVVGNWDIHGLVERYLQLAIECSLSLGEQVISNHGFRQPGSYRDVVYILAEQKVFSRKFADEIADLAGFRNVLVHGYIKIDRNLVYQHLQKDIPKLRRYAQYLARFVKV